jgi:hypothetical protein
MNTLAHTILNRSNALRVSDRSGTPQAGDPAEEYSGVRDPEALRGARPNWALSDVLGVMQDCEMPGTR